MKIIIIIITITTIIVIFSRSFDLRHRRVRAGNKVRENVSVLSMYLNQRDSASSSMLKNVGRCWNIENIPYCKTLVVHEKYRICILDPR